MKKKTVRIVFAGYGALAEQLARLLAAEPCCRVVAVADPSRKALDKATSLYQVSTFPTLAKALEAADADVAVINTPAHQAHDLAVSAFERGLHVLVTRPMADSARLAAIAKLYRRKLGLAADAAAALDYLRELELAVPGKARGPASPGSR